MKNLLKLKGATILDKKQQGLVVGGRMQGDSNSSICYFIVTRPDGHVQTGYFDVGVGGAGASSAANSACVEAIESGNATRCQYDCEYDGYGQ